VEAESAEHQTTGPQDGVMLMLMMMLMMM